MICDIDDCPGGTGAWGAWRAVLGELIDIAPCAVPTSRLIDPVPELRLKSFIRYRLQAVGWSP